MKLIKDFRYLPIPEDTENPVFTKSYNKIVEDLRAISQSRRSRSGSQSQSLCSSISFNVGREKSSNIDSQKSESTLQNVRKRIHAGNGQHGRHMDRGSIDKRSFENSNDPVITYRGRCLDTTPYCPKSMRITFENRSERAKSSFFEVGADKTDAGTWVQCCKVKCGKWRFLAHCQDPTEIPETWYCHMNWDTNFSSCDIEEEWIPEYSSGEFIENKYTAGSIVWARLEGYPWWPAIVDDCPELLQFYELKKNSIIPTKYHVVFLDQTKIQRAWIADKDLKAYGKNSREVVVKKIKFRGKNYERLLDTACALADEAQLLRSPQSRLGKFGWNARLAEKFRPVAKSIARIGRKIGDIVWASLHRMPRWPAMINQCPDLGKHHRLAISRKVEVEYYVVYFNGVKLETDWVPDRALRLFSTHRYPNRRESLQRGRSIGNKGITEADFENACELAKEAQRLSVEQRLQRFGVDA